MTMLHAVLDEGDPFARGEALGRQFADAISTNVAAYRSLFDAVGVDPAHLPDHGEAALAAVLDWAPDLHLEMLGLAAGSGREPWEIGMMNARTEVLATVGATAEGECSTGVHVPAAGAPKTIQTWDWHDTMDAGKATVVATLASGRVVRYFTEAGIVGKIGLSSAGLGVHFNILSHRDDGDGIGVPVHVVARRILDEATTIDDAVAIVRSARVTASTVLTVVTYDGERGDAACIELSSGGVAVVRPDDSGFLLHTNHFLDPVLAEGELSLPTASTHARLKHLLSRRELIRTPDPVGRVEALHLHDIDGAPLCCHPLLDLPFHEQWRTLLTVELDLAAGVLQLHDGGPCSVDRATWQTV